MKHWFRRFRAPLTVVALLAGAACSTPDASRDVSALLSPSREVIRTLAVTQTLLVGDSLDAKKLSPLASTTISMNGVTSSLPVTWTSTASAVATVSSSGMVTGRGAGTARIIASYSTLADTVPVSVVASTTPVASIAVSGTTTSISVGATTQLTATARDAGGNVIKGIAFTWRSASSTIATVTSTGLVTGMSAGSTTISATSGGVTGNFALSVVAAAPLPTLPAGPIVMPTPPTIITPRYPTVTGKSWFVAAGGNLQGALNNAQRGDEIVLQAGATFTGNFVLPAKPGTSANGWIVIRSEKLSSLPPAGTRVTPAQASLMPKLLTTSVAPVLATAPYASGWWIAGVEMTVAPALTYVHYGLVTLGDGSSKQNALSLVPNDLVLDRTYVHGQPTVQLIRCVALNSASTAITDSYLQDCHAKGFDSQAIAMWNGPGPYKIVNNTLAGAGENLIFGGADPAITNLIPSDVELRRNYIYTPASWKGGWTKKNLLETKNAQRVLVEDNVFDGTWQDAQIGYAMVLKVANQSGRCTWCTTTDLIFRRNIIRNVGAGFGITGKEGGNSYPIGGLLNRLLIEQNIIENVNVGIYTGDARMISIMQDAQNVTIRRNTMTSSGSMMQYLNLGTANAGTNFAFEDNIITYGKYGFFSSWYGIGETSLQGFKGTVSFKHAVMIGSLKSGYPNGIWVSSLAGGLATGYGTDPASVIASTAGVTIP